MRNLLQFLYYKRKERTNPVKWSGNYTSWEDALKHSTGYDNPEIFQKVFNSARKVAAGEAVYERDGILFDEVENSWPLLSGILLAISDSIKNDVACNILDFGGGLGSSFFQNKKFLSGFDLNWNIIEQGEFVTLGKSLPAGQPLYFYHSIKEYLGEKPIPHATLLSSTIQYLKDPYKVLDEIIKVGAKYLIIDNTPLLSNRSADTLTIQQVKEPIYNASYPCWFLSEIKLRAFIEKRYEVLEMYENEVYIIREGKKLPYKGIIAKLKT